MTQPTNPTPACAGCAGCGGPDCAQRPVPSPVPDALTQRVAAIVDDCRTLTPEALTTAVLAALAPALDRAEQAIEEAGRRAEAMEFAMRSTAAEALKHGGCHRKLMTQVRRAEQAEAALARVLEEIRSLHGREKDGTCGSCIEFSNERHTTYEAWPCSTIRELNAALDTPATDTSTKEPS